MNKFIDFMGFKKNFGCGVHL